MVLFLTHIEQWQYTGRNSDVIVSYFITKKNNSVGPWASFSSFIFCSLLYFTRYCNWNITIFMVYKTI